MIRVDHIFEMIIFSHAEVVIYRFESHLDDGVAVGDAGFRQAVVVDHGEAGGVNRGGVMLLEE